jgi:Protein of unknown function (DUF444)
MDTQARSLERRNETKCRESYGFALLWTPVWAKYNNQAAATPSLFRCVDQRSDLRRQIVRSRLGTNGVCMRMSRNPSPARFPGRTRVALRRTPPRRLPTRDVFNGTQTGGTKVLSALAKMHKIISSRYPASSYNVFGAQASDGDSFGENSTEAYLLSQLLPESRYL